MFDGSGSRDGLALHHELSERMWLSAGQADDFAQRMLAAPAPETGGSARKRTTSEANRVVPPEAGASAASEPAHSAPTVAEPGPPLDSGIAQPAPSGDVRRGQDDIAAAVAEGVRLALQSIGKGSGKGSAQPAEPASPALPGKPHERARGQCVYDGFDTPPGWKVLVGDLPARSDC